MVLSQKMKTKQPRITKFQFHLYLSKGSEKSHKSTWRMMEKAY